MRAAISALKYSSLAAVIAIAGASVAAAQERVTWTEQANVAVRGNTLEKTRGCDGCGDAGATSTQVIESNGGYVEFRIPEDWTYLVAGLAFRTRGTRFEDIEFGIRFNGNGSADIVESGRYVGGDTEYTAGDAFRIEVVNDRVRYLRNGDLMTTSRRRPTYPLAFDVGLGTIGASVADARMGAGRADDRAGLDDRDEFRTLDRNDDGAITRQEWSGNRRAFDERDANGDGRITQRELNAFDRRDDAADDRGVAGTSGELIPVSARDRWTDTGLTVRSGDTITFAADGTIQMSGERGDTANPAGSRRSAPEALVRNSPAGTLIARIGNGAPFAVGARRTIARAPASGRLYLGVNDDYLEDNDGEFRVTVTIEPR
jgi:PA-IL-like protein/EF hand